MIKKYIFLTLLSFVLLSLSPTATLAADQTITFTTTGARNIPKNLNGINEPWLLVTPIWYNFQQEAINRLNANLIRFPGGTVGNFYNWETFAPDWDAALQIFHGRQEGVDGIKRSFDSLVVNLDPIAFINVVKQNNKEVILVLNVFSNTPQQIRDGLATIKAAGITVKYAELGNEMYLYQVAMSREIYLSKAEATAGKVKVLFPGIKLGINAGPLNLYPGWEFPNADWFDALVFHPYNTLVGSFDTIGIGPLKNHILNTIPEGISTLVDHAREKYPDKELWFTEWNIRGGNLYFMNTYAHAVYAYNFRLNLLKYPKITIANWHLFMSKGKKQSLFRPKAQIIADFYNQSPPVNPPNNEYDFDRYSVKNTSFWPAYWIGQAFAAYNKFTIVDNVNIIAAYFFNTDQPGKGDVAIINKTGDTRNVTMLGIESIPRTAQILAKAWNAKSSETNPMQPTSQSIPANTITLAPYAIAYISSVASPTPTPIPSPTPTPIFNPADLNQDGKVDIYDYNILVTDFGKTGTPGWIRADIIENGEVDIFDYNVLVENFGK